MTESKDELINDSEFRFLKQYQPDTDPITLENDLRMKGCMNPLLVWNGCLIDGYKRYDICRKEGIPFRIQNVTLNSRADAVFMICSEELRRKDLNENMRKYLIGKKYKAVIRINSAKHHCTDADGSGSLSGIIGSSALEVAEELKISPGTVRKYGEYADALDRIRFNVPSLADRLMRGRLGKFSHIMALEMSKMDTDACIALMLDINSKKLRSITMHDIRRAQEFSARNKTDSPIPLSVPKIKCLPREDPDERIKSLTITIPYWVDTLQNACAKSDMSAVSTNAKERLTNQLDTLSGEIRIIRNRLMEEYANVQ